MSDYVLPRGMRPVGAYCGRAVEVVAPPVVVMDRHDEARIKENLSFPGRTPHRLRVEVIAGTRKKRLPDGREMEVMVTDEIAVTVWAERPLTCDVGDYVVLRDLMVGAVDGNLYFWATGADAHEAAAK